MDTPDIKTMVDRFLSWRLPDDFHPDCAVSFNPELLKPWPHLWPIGTNILTAAQAEKMIRFLLTGEEG